MYAVSMWTERISDDQTLEFARAFAKELAGDRCEELMRLVTSGDWLSLLKYEPSTLLGPVDYALEAQIHGLFKKLECLPTGIDRQAVAMEKFVEAERACAITNDAFDAWGEGRFQFDPYVDGILHAASRKIQQVMGEVPQLDTLRARFTSGASTSVKKKDASLRNQFLAAPTCSEELRSSHLLAELLETLPHYTGIHVSGPDVLRIESYDVHVTVHASKLEFVPKDAKTYRSIIKDPLLNKVIQLCYGDYLKDRLLSVGLDLSNGQHTQRALAKKGSLTGDLATLDLSSASDLISRNLVRHLLPYEWYETLSDCCSSTISFGGAQVYLEKFAGMGNGFTFPLETLIFWALCKAVEEDTMDVKDRIVKVYGDDIICPTECVAGIFRVFQSCGFSINKSKSFWTGEFRESCGSDWISGKQVRPVFLRDNVSMELLYSLHNQFYRKDELKACAFILGYIPEKFKIFGPDGYGDGHLLGDWTPIPYSRTSRNFDSTWERTTQPNNCEALVHCAKQHDVETPNGWDLVQFKSWSRTPSVQWDRQSWRDYAVVLYWADEKGYKDYGTHRRYSTLEEHDRLMSGLCSILSSNDNLNPYNVGKAITAARNAVMRSGWGSEVLPSVQRVLKRWMLHEGEQLSDFPGGSIGRGIGTPLPGSSGEQMLTICTFAR